MIRLRNVIILSVQVLLLTAITIFCVMPFSCRLTEEGIVFVGGDYTAPVIETVEVIDERTVEINFSEGISISSVVVSKMIEELSDSMEHSTDENPSPAIAAAAGEYGTIDTTVQISEDCTAVKFIMESECEIGQRYEIYGVVEDKTGNTLSFCVPFTGYNSHIPKVIMTEFLVKHSASACKSEFVEILALTDGNLAGIELVSGSDGENKKFVMPPVEVAAGEIVLVHLRNFGEGCITETTNLDEATAPNSWKGVRDIWSANEGSALNDSNDVIVLRNGPEGEIMDAFMYTDGKAEDWKKQKSLAEQVRASGIYESADIRQAFCNASSSTVKSYQRVNAGELKAAALNGTIDEYPVKHDDEDWDFLKATPGVL